MKRILVALFCLIALAGCGDIRNDMSHLKSTFTGLTRVVTLYDNSGGVIKTWTVKAKVEDNGGSFRFLTDDNKAVVISGTVLIEEQ